MFSSSFSTFYHLIRFLQSRLLKNAHLRRFPCPLAGPSSLQRTCSTPLADSPTRRRGEKSLLIRRDATLGISEALHLVIFEQPEKTHFSRKLLNHFLENFRDVLNLYDLTILQG